MPSEPKNLLALQRHFMAAIREPIYAESRELTSLTSRPGKVSAAFSRLAKDEIRSTPNLEAQERLELYHRQYWFRLLDSMDEDFPALKKLLGEEKFWRLIEAYLELVPSRSYTLRHLGGGLADFLKINPGLAAGHPVHAAELAQIEYALCEIFEEPRRPLVAVEKLATATLALQPHLKLFAFRTPADEIWRLEADAEIPEALLVLPDGRNHFHVAVFRLGSRLKVRRIDAGEFSVLQAIALTGSLAQALDSIEATADEVGAWFQTWTELGWLCERPSAAGKIEIEQPASDRRSINIPLHYHS